ncbi:MAG TPA: Uma2 family endonuclease [Ilumatobacteraceae bacterium]
MVALDLPRHRWTRTEYALLDPDVFARCELIEGEIIDVSPMSRAHALVTDQIRDLMSRLVDPMVMCAGSQTPIIIDEYSEPEPDVWVAHVPRRNLAEGKPLPEELALVIEVAESSLRVDRRLKLPLYASAGIPVMWLVDLAAERIEIHGEPDAAERRYATVQLHEEGSSVPLPWGGEVAFNELLLR